MKVNMDRINEKAILFGRVKCILTDVKTGEQEIKEYNNLIVTVGKVAIARRLGGIALLANEGQCTYGAVGTDATAPLVTDTVLGTELARKALSVTSYVSNVITLRTFYTTAEANGALKEFGLFGEAATAAADSGTMFNHAAIDLTKDNTKTLIVEVTITIS